jgi:hypothetical protein
MPAQRNLAHAKATDAEIIFVVHVGNGNLGDSVVKVGGNFLNDSNGQALHFQDNFEVSLGSADQLIGKEIEVISTLAPAPGLPDQTLILTYDLVNADFILDKSRTLMSTASQNGNDLFDVTINLL